MDNILLLIRYVTDIGEMHGQDKDHSVLLDDTVVELSLQQLRQVLSIGLMVGVEIYLLLIDVFVYLIFIVNLCYSLFPVGFQRLDHFDADAYYPLLEEE